MSRVELVLRLRQLLLDIVQVQDHVVNGLDIWQSCLAKETWTPSRVLLRLLVVLGTSCGKASGQVAEGLFARRADDTTEALGFVVGQLLAQFFVQTDQVVVLTLQVLDLTLHVVHSHAVLLLLLVITQL